MDDGVALIFYWCVAVSMLIFCLWWMVSVLNRLQEIRDGQLATRHAVEGLRKPVTSMAPAHVGRGIEGLPEGDFPGIRSGSREEPEEAGQGGKLPQTALLPPEIQRQAV